MAKFISAQEAYALDQDLMTSGGFSIDQLMELAGLSVSQVIHLIHPHSMGTRILVACGPGNNGGDGLVAARHLKHFGYQPMIYYPKRNNNDLFQRLVAQLEDLDVPFFNDFYMALNNCDHIIDAIFGEIREPFPAIITALEGTQIPVTSIDVPSSWDVETGPRASGLGSNFNPSTLVSLCAPKPLVRYYRGRHFIGGRFISPRLEQKFSLQRYDYQGVSQIVEI